jgi:hypothetical protein
MVSCENARTVCDDAIIRNRDQRRPAAIVHDELADLCGVSATTKYNALAGGWRCAQASPLPLRVANDAHRVYAGVTINTGR